jgi:hypothetical protein
VGFEQAKIAVEKVEEFEILKSAIQRVLSPAAVAQFLKLVEKAGLRARDFELMLERGIFEKLDQPLKQSGKSANELYRGLTISDQGLMREYFLEAVETVAQETREKYRKIYGYY